MVERLHRWWPWGLFLLSVALYAPTIGHDYNMDDELVTLDHRNTSRGLAGVSDILSEFYYEDDMGYRYGYRPVAHVVFAVEHAVFGQSPHTSHAINVLLYALLCVLVYWFIRRLDERIPRWAAAAGSLLFAIHPIHTEVVASIKNREEILALLFPLAAALLLLRARWSRVDGRVLVTILGAAVLFALGYFSKRSGVGFAVILPMVLVVRNRDTNTVRWDVLLLTILPCVPLLLDVRVLDARQRWVLVSVLLVVTSLATHARLVRAAMIEAIGRSKRFVHRAAGRVRTALVSVVKMALHHGPRLLFAVGQWLRAMVRFDESVRGVTLVWSLVSVVFLVIAWLFASIGAVGGLVAAALVVHGLIAFGTRSRTLWHLVWVLLALVLAIFVDPESNIVPVALIAATLSLAADGAHGQRPRWMVGATFVLGVGLSIAAQRPWTEIALIVPYAAILFVLLPALANRARWAVWIVTIFLGLHLFDFDVLALCAVATAVVMYTTWRTGKDLHRWQRLLLGFLVLSSAWSIIRAGQLDLPVDSPVREAIEETAPTVSQWSRDLWTVEEVVQDAPTTLRWCGISSTNWVAAMLASPPSVAEGHGPVDTAALNTTGQPDPSEEFQVAPGRRIQGLDRPLTRAENPLIEAFTWPNRIRTALATTGFYSRKMVWPHPLSFYYGFAVRDIPPWTDPEVWLGGVSIVSLLLLLAYGVRRGDPLLVVGAVIVLLSLAVYSNAVTPVAGMVGERMAFQASLGVILLSAALMAWCVRRWSRRPVLFALGVLVVAGSVHTVRRSGLWADRVTLFGHDVQHLEQSAQANALYAYARLTSGADPRADRETALVHLDRALAIVPDYPNWWYDKGRVLWELGRSDEAVPAFRAAVRYQDDLFLGPDRYLVDYAVQNSDPVALIDPARRMVRHSMPDARLHDLLAESFLMTGRPDSALVYLRLQTERFPERPEPWLTMARIHARMSADSQALESLIQAEQRTNGRPDVQRLVDSLRREVNE